MVAAQEPGAAQLWDLAGSTLPVAQALATGGTSAVWNPAQPPPPGRASLCLEMIQTPAAVGAEGLLFVARLRVRAAGELGIVYGTMKMSDLIRTELSPSLDSSSIPYYAQFIAASWTKTHRGTTLGATFGLQDITLDRAHRDGPMLDLGIAQMLPWGFRVAVAGHVVATLAAGDPDHDIYGGIERRMWRGTPWRGSGPVSLTARYGIAVGRGFGADHEFGAGVDVGNQFLADLHVARESGYGVPEWRGSAGIRIRIGRYRVNYARDTGVSEIGSAYRIGLEARVQVIDLLSLTPQEARAALEQWAAERAEPAYRVRQILPRLWARPVSTWNEASDLPHRCVRSWSAPSRSPVSPWARTKYRATGLRSSCGRSRTVTRSNRS